MLHHPGANLSEKLVTQKSSHVGDHKSDNAATCPPGAATMGMHGLSFTLKP